MCDFESACYERVLADAGTAYLTKNGKVEKCKI